MTISNVHALTLALCLPTNLTSFYAFTTSEVFLFNMLPATVKLDGITSFQLLLIDILFQFCVDSFNFVGGIPEPILLYCTKFPPC